MKSSRYYARLILINITNQTGNGSNVQSGGWLLDPPQAYSQLFLACVLCTCWRRADQQICIIFIPLDQPVSLFPSIVVCRLIRHCSVLTGIKTSDPHSPPSASCSPPSGLPTWRSPSLASCSLLQSSVLLLQQCLQPHNQMERPLSACIHPHWCRS